MSKAIVLFSGGLDSTTCLYLAKKENSHVIALSFHYSQKHIIELKYAKKICKNLYIEHKIIKINPGIFLGSSLTQKNIKVPKNKLSSTKIPNTYVPGRNILFLAFANSLAESLKYNKIYIGVNVLDYSGYPDCRPEFIKQFQCALKLGTKVGVENSGVQIITPLIYKSKKEIIQLGASLNVPFQLTHSCYDPKKGKPCGKCDSCILRQNGFRDAGIES